jgi:hypothetical protein
MPGAQFLSCDQIMPFDRMTFGLIDPYDRGVRIFRVEKYVNPNDRIILAWKQSKSWLTGRYIMMEAKKNGTRRVAMQTLGWHRPDDPHAKKYGQHEFEWYDLGPDDLIAVEVGTYYANANPRRFEAQNWPDAYQPVEAPEPGEWERRQKFTIPNPPSSPWRKWDELVIDPTAPIGPKTWVAGFERGEGLQRPILGPAKHIQQKFTVTDVRTGRDVTMGSNYTVLYGAVVGMSRCLLDRKKRNLAATAEMEKVAEKAKRRAASKAGVAP